MEQAQDRRRWPKPLPEASGLAGEFYAFCRCGELRFQRCRRCGTWRHVPREMCPKCRSTEWAWERSSGRGRVFTWVVVARAMHPAFADETPYAPVIVELEEGVRLLTRVADIPPEELKPDMPVEVTFQVVDERIALPYFRPARAEGSAGGTQ